MSLPEKPFTRRGVLSIVNSVYDPLGFVAPVMLEGRKILQQLVLMGERRAENKTPLAWDNPLPTVMMNRWTRWRDSLIKLQHLSVPCCYHPREFGTVTRAELHTFSDESGCHRSRCLPAERSERDLDITCLRPSKSCPCYPYQHTTTGTVRSSASSPSSSKSP